jgi:hypothetical protein
MITHDFITWTDWELDNLNVPYEPEWMSTGVNPANFMGIRGEYGGYFSGGRYSFEVVTPEITYEDAYCPHLSSSVPDGGSTLLLGMVALCLIVLAQAAKCGRFV